MMLVSLWNRFLAFAEVIGGNTQESPELHRQKTLLIAMSFIINGAAVFWSLVYLALGEPIPFLIAALGEVIFVLNVVFFRQQHHFAIYRLIEHLKILIMPFLAGFVLGGFWLSSGVFLAGFLAPIEALILRDLAMARRLFLGFIALLIIGVIVQPSLRTSNHLSDVAITFFYAVNVGVVFAIAMLVLVEAFARQHRLEKQVMELRIEIDKSKELAQIDEIVDTDYFKDLMGKAKQVHDKKAEGRSADPTSTQS